MSTQDADLASLGAVTRNLAAAVRAIGSDQWSLPTPCSDWDVTALVDHITGGNWFTTAVLAGEQAEDAKTAAMDRFAGGSATCEAAIQSLTEQAVAFLRPQVLDRTWNHIIGDISGSQILRLRLHDLIVHNWDLDEALRPAATLPADLARWGLDELRHDDSLAAQHFHVTNVPALHSPEDSASSYLQAFGR